jgi:hypothetical protein
MTARQKRLARTKRIQRERRMDALAGKVGMRRLHAAAAHAVRTGPLWMEAKYADGGEPTAARIDD